MKRIVDENGRVFGKISIIDLFVIIIAILLIIVVSLKTGLNKSEGAASSGSPVRYTLRITGSTVDCSSILKPGDTVYSSDGPAVGTIVSVTVSPAKVTSANSKGEYVTSTVDGKYDADVVIETLAAETGGRYIVGNVWEINAGTLRNYFTKYYSFSAAITEIG